MFDRMMRQFRHLPHVTLAATFCCGCALIFGYEPEFAEAAAIQRPSAKTSARSSSRTARHVGGLTSYPAGRVGPNLLTNPGFDQIGPNGKPLGWGDNGFTADSSTKRSGTGSYRITDANLIDYSQSASQSLQLSKGTYSFSGWVKLQNMAAVTGNGVRLCLSVGPSWPYTVTACTDIVKGTSDWQQLSLSKIVVPADSPAKFELSTYADPDGTAWFDDVELRKEGIPLEVYLLYPNYRGMLFDDQSQTARFDLSVDPPAGTALSDYQVSATVTDEAASAAVLEKAFAASTESVAELDFSQLPTDHTYAVAFHLIRAVGDAAVYDYPAYRIVKVPGSLRRSMTLSFDEQNRILVRGQPTFLLGVYDSALGYTTVENGWEDMLTTQRRLFELPINLYLNYWYGGASNDSILPLMNVLQRRGILFLQTSNCFASSPAGGEFWWETEPMADLQARAGHPGFAGVYVADECRGDLAQDVFAHRSRTLEADPDGVTLGTLLGDASLTMWRDTVDLVATDPYPLYGAEPAGGYPLAQVADWTRASRAAVKDSRPVMTVIQFLLGTLNSRWPTQEELRNMSYMAIVEGANGLMYWSLGARALAYVCDGSTPEKSPGGSTSWCPFKVDLFSRLKAVVTEIKGLEAGLAGADRPDLLASNSNAAVRTRVKYADGIAYLLAYNSGTAVADVTFTLAQTPSSLTVYGEPREVSAAGGTFSDQLGAYAARVYRIVLP
jgi:hypothetical protein